LCDKIFDEINSGLGDIFKFRIDGEKLRVIYGIITKKAKENMDNRSINLPIFSRISLSKALYSLRMMNIPCSVFLIPDRADRRNRD